MNGGNCPNTLCSVHVIAGLDAAHGGPSYSVPRLCQGLAGIGADVELFSVKGDDGATDRSETGFRDRRFAPDYTKVPLLRRLRCSAALAKGLKEVALFSDIIHDHGIWLMPNVVAGRVARDARKPLIVSPRGMLAPEALAFSRLRKRAFWTLVQGPSVCGAACFHATSEQEYDEIRSFGLRNPVAVIGNGIDVPEALRRGAKKPTTDRTVLSLGRLHPKKGLHRLLYAWAKIETSHPEWRLRIVGPAEAGHDNELRALAAKLRLGRISVEGPIYGAAKEEAYRVADLFVLSSLNENFGQTVAEALAAELPVISTKGAPWSGLVTEGCGWWIDHGVEPLVEALVRAIELPDVKRATMGSKGRAWIARDFSWERVAREMLAVYRWLAKRDELPSLVRFD